MSRSPANNRVNLRVNRCSHRLTQETDPVRRASLLHQLHAWKTERARTPSTLLERTLAYVRRTLFRIAFSSVPRSEFENSRNR